MVDPGDILILGAGGHAKVILHTMMAVGLSVGGFLDDNPVRQQSLLDGYPILGPIHELQAWRGQRCVIGIGDNLSRQRMALRFAHQPWQTVIHPQAIVDPSAQIGEGSVIFAGAVVQASARIGKHCIINTGATVDHDCDLGDYVHLAPGVHLAGHVTIQEGCFLGIGTVVIPSLIIHAWATIGAGSVVVRTISAHSKAYGVPAKMI